jgi:hypothetical protein
VNVPQRVAPKRGLGTGWIIAIVAIGVVVVVGIGVGAFALLNRGSGDEVAGKYGSTPLPSCDDVATQVKDLPPKTSETEFGPTSGWRCTFYNSADVVTVDIDVELKTVQQQHSGFELYTSSGGYVPDATVHLGENAAWGPSGTGKLCGLAVWDSNAKFKVDLNDSTLTANDVQTCRDRVKTIARSFYEAMQPR